MAQYQTTYIVSLKDLYSRVMNQLREGTERFERGVDRANSKADGLGRTVRRVGGLIVAAFSVAAMRSFADETEQAYLRMGALEQKLRAGFGSAQAANKELSYTSRIANDLGIDLLAASDGYAKFAIAAKGTALEGKGARDVFEGISIAAAGAGLSADQVSGAVTALEQILSKGKVQAEELRGQLGERIPGAFRIAAEAMGMTTKELDKFMSEGKLTADEFLPRFANALKQNFASAADAYKQSNIAERQRQINETFRIQAEIGEQLVPIMYAFRSAQLAVLKAVSHGIKFFKDNESVIKGVAVAVGILTGAYYANAAAQAFMAVRAGILTTQLWIQAAANGALSSSIRLLGVAINTALGPIGWVSLAISALTGVIVWAWNRFEGFRGAVYGTWEAIKQFGQNVWSFVKSTFQPFIEAWAKFQAGDYTGSLASLGKGLWNITAPGMIANIVKERNKLVEGISDAYARGDKKGRQSFIDSKSKDQFSSPAFDRDVADLSTSGTSAASTSSMTSRVEAKSPQNIYIDIGSFGEINMSVDSITQGAEEIKTQLHAALLSVVNDVQLKTSR